MGGNLRTRFFGALHEKAAVGDQVLPEEAEITAWTQGTGALKRGDEVALEEVCAGGEGNGVTDMLAEGGG